MKTRVNMGHWAKEHPWDGVAAASTAVVVVALVLAVVFMQMKQEAMQTIQDASQARPNGTPMNVFMVSTQAITSQFAIVSDLSSADINMESFVDADGVLLVAVLVMTSPGGGPG